MDKKEFDGFQRALSQSGGKSAAALRQIITELEARENRADGAFSARERLVLLFDAGTFMETGAYITRRNSEYEENAADSLEGVICGWGAVNGRLVYAFSQDMARTHGAVSETQAQKIGDLYRMATENGAPIVGIFDSAGAYLPEGVRALAAYGKIMKDASMASGVVPQIAVVPGISQGAAAVIAGMFDFMIVTEKTSTVSVNPPFAVGGNSGTSQFAGESGLAALCAANEEEAFQMTRELLSLLPSNNAEGTVEQAALDEINRMADVSAYEEKRDIHDLLAAFADGGEYTELWASYAAEAVCAFVQIGGMVCGVVGNNHTVQQGMLTAAAARKMAKMISFCDSFHIPVVTLVDSCGPDVSIEAEKSPYAAELAKLAHVYAMARTPLVTLVAGEAYGTVFTLMGSKAIGADVVLALDSAKIGTMKASAAVAFLWNDQIAGDITREELEQKWDAVIGTPVAAARAGEVDDIIASGELRQRIASAILMLAAKSKNAPLRRHVNMPL